MFHTEEIKFNSVSVHLLYYDSIDTMKHLDYLLPTEIEVLQNIRHIEKKKEYIAVRILRTLLFGKTPIIYSDIGAPSINNGLFISISHAFNIVGIAVCKLFPVGFDIEIIRDKVLDLKHKFLSKEEFIQSDTSSVEEMIKFWSGKEALYKLAGRKKIIFSENLLLTKIDDRSWQGQIVFKNKKIIVPLTIIKKNGFVISVNNKPVKKMNSNYDIEQI